jgi:signal recognition particle subunit SRP54
MNLLAEKLQQVFRNVRGYGKLTEANTAEALREVRLALLAADVNYLVAKRFCDRVKAQALGQEVQQSIRPGDLFVKIVHDELIALFQSGGNALDSTRPLRIALCGLNGAGKTTSAAKLARWLKDRRERPLLVAADLARPAAAAQLSTLATQIGVPAFLPTPGTSLPAHLAAAETAAREAAATVVIYDLAGRSEVNDALLEELQSALTIIRPHECLLVADAALGQAAVEVAQAFHARARLTGLILSKFDGDARGGAAFSLQQVTGCPIKFLGTGEKTGDFEPFQPERLVQRLLGMGDLYGLAQKVQETIDIEDAARLEEKLKKQSFDLQDFQDQLRMLKKLGPLQNILGMIPGMGSISNSAIDERGLKRTEAILGSMTPQERRHPDIISARRRQRIALGSGTSVTEVNQLLHRFRAMKKMMGKLTRGGRPDEQMKKLLRGRAF